MFVSALASHACSRDFLTSCAATTIKVGAAAAQKANSTNVLLFHIVSQMRRTKINNHSRRVSG
jgi:hypothetical protein